MAYITLDGKEYELHFKNRELRELEERTGMGMQEFFTQLDGGKITPMYTLLFVMLKRHDEFKPLTEDGFMDLLDDEMEKELDFEQLGEILKDVVENSVFMKQAQTQAKPTRRKKVVG